MTQWDYKVLTFRIGEFRKSIPDYEDIERQLKELGGQGWEVVSSAAPGRGQGQSTELVLVARRPL